MKKFTILVAVMLMATASLFAQWPASFGPDAYGYNAETFDENDTQYQWIDISTRGIEITGLGDDNTAGPFNLGFGFQFYWTQETQVCVGSNGYIQFGGICDNIASGGNQGFATMPTSDQKDDVIAAFLSDLKFDGAGNPAKAYFYTNQVDTAIITFSDVPFWLNNATQFGGSNTFQVILNAADSTIKVLYQSQSGSWDPNYDATTAPAVIGIENISGTIGLGINASLTNVTDLLPANKTGVVFTAPSVPGINVPDVEPQAVQNDRSAGFFLPEGATDYEFRTTVANVGNVDLTTVTDAYLELTNQGGTALWNDTIKGIPGLNVGQKSSHAFPLKFNFFSVNTPATQTTYAVNVEVVNQADQNFGNNEVELEAVAVDTTAGKALFSFVEIVDRGQVDAAVLWTGGGGDDGAGVYIQPYGYPTVIEAVDVFVQPAIFGTQANPTNLDTIPDGPFKVAIYAEDANGKPGALLWEKTVATQDVDIAGPIGAQGQFLGDWNRVELDTADYITIDSGGVYVGWFHFNDSLQLGGQTTTPISRQSYEILGGSWAPHRSGNTEDYGIRMYADVSGVIPDTIVDPPNAVEPELPSLSTFNVFPNPTTGLLKLELAWDQPTSAMIKIMDLQGSKVYLDITKATTSYNKSIDLSQLAKGIYLVQVSTNIGQQTRKLVIR